MWQSPVGDYHIEPRIKTPRANALRTVLPWTISYTIVLRQKNRFEMITFNCSEVKIVAIGVPLKL